MEGGSKTIERVGDILRAFERGSEHGMTSGEIATATGFDKATAYRALVSLGRIGLVDRDTESRRFRLGVYLFNLGAIAARRFSVLAHAREIVAEIAKETGDTVFLSVRNRHESVCIDCATGSYPIKAQTLTVGESVPLGVSAGGVAMLATMTDAEVRHSIQYNAVEISKFHSVRPDDIFEHVDAARHQGYAHYAGQVVAGMGAVARPIRGPSGQGIAVISVTAVLDRLSQVRVRMINDLLKAGIEKIEQRALLIGNRLETIA
ncbi:IclR family transcriptional regulator [Sphingomonas bacterium]|uniref:IclR family transcriptional regulator n=1 Tax=Sphingomonas bacterium TaxID=1895847 RepID=UPI00157700AA|nr:IclR family transcriptional regulator [Sphingomonas bacterium]